MLECWCSDTWSSDQVLSQCDYYHNQNSIQSLKNHNQLKLVNGFGWERWSENDFAKVYQSLSISANTRKFGINEPPVYVDPRGRRLPRPSSAPRGVFLLPSMIVLFLREQKITFKLQFKSFKKANQANKMDGLEPPYQPNICNKRASKRQKAALFSLSKPELRKAQIDSCCLLLSNSRWLPQWLVWAVL